MASILVWTLAGIVLVVAGTIGYYVVSTRRISAHAEKMVPPSGAFVTVDGNRIHYIESGEGRPILMLHGLGGHLHHMRRPLMQEFGAGYRLIAIDRAGSGYSTRGAGLDGRLTEQARLVAGFIDALALDRPLLVGHSLGGAVALATALDHPEKVSGLALISPLTRSYKSVPPEFAALYIESPRIRRLIANTIAVPLSVKNAPRTLAFVFGPQQPPTDFAVEGGAMSGLRPSHIFATSTDLVALKHDLPQIEKRYGEIEAPVGILFGASDRVLDHRVHGLEMAGQVPGLDLEILQGIGHMPQYAATGRVVAFIRRMAQKAFAD